MNKRIRRLIFSILTLGTFVISVYLGGGLIIPAIAQTPIIDHTTVDAADLSLEAKGNESYQQGEFQQAIDFWLEASEFFSQQEDLLSQARLLSNLSLAYQQLGQWNKATEMITASLNLFSKITLDQQSNRVLAQALNTQGSLQLALGQAELALQTWEKAAKTYQQADYQLGYIQAEINQTQAMQALGFYRLAIDTLTEVKTALENICEGRNLTLLNPNTTLNLSNDVTCKSSSAAWQIITLDSLGNILRLVGDLPQSEVILQQSLTIAQNLKSDKYLAISYFSLGHTFKAKGDLATALNYYQQALAKCNNPEAQLPKQLAQLSLLLAMEESEKAIELLPTIQSNFASLTLNHRNIYLKINFVHSLLNLKQSTITGENLDKIPTWQDLAILLSQAAAAAKELGDQRAEAYALGSLGEIYQQTQQWSTAEKLTEEALLKASTINAPEISYLWQWQLGKILKVQGEKAKAISYLTEAVNTLQSLNNDLLTANPDVQFSFRDSVEPVYRELVSLLLEGNIVSQENLIQARNVIESLQLAELDNFFQEACLEAKAVKIDNIDQKAAVIYPMILEDRLEVILSLPEHPLTHHVYHIPATEINQIITQLNKGLVVRSKRDFFQPAQELYDWIISPIASQLTQNGIKTLVFVPDSSFRNIPLGTLYDGKQFLIEKYAIAVTPGLQLLSPKPLQELKLKTLALGLTEKRDRFPALKYVAEELQEIQKKVSSVVLLDEKFTEKALRQEIQFSNFPVIHIATHGQFSSRLADTFLLAWDSRITINQLDNILGGKNLSEPEAIELLVLSACETATGDKKAALGLAGMAVRAGARSTVATLWSINDQATAKLMSKFYEQLNQQEVSKSEALRQAQLSLLNAPAYRHPFYWAAYILVGNWL